MGSVQIREVAIGNGTPKICAVLDGVLREDILEQIDDALEAGAEMTEWQVDAYSWHQSEEKLMKTLRLIREKLQQVPLIFNFRSRKAGGYQDILIADYRKLYLEAASSDCIDLAEIDMEFMEQLGSSFLQLLKETGVKVVLCDNYPETTPEDSLLLFRLNLMEHLGADVGKVVVQPKKAQDVFRLMELTLQAEAFVCFPIIAISLGELGKFSRISGELSHSAITYASVRDEPQAGEYNIYDLKDALELVHIEKVRV